MKILMVVYLFSAVKGSMDFGLTPFSQSEVCQSAAEYGVNMTTFFVNVAHMVHDITLEDIRYFFDPNFPVENSVPTVNANLTGDFISWKAPSNPSEFKFPGGAIVDFIMKNNDDVSTFRWNGLTSLEKISHQAHMLEMWMQASQEFKKLESANIITAEVCPCLVNETANGIIDALVDFAKTVRKPVGRPNSNGEGNERKRRAAGKQFASNYWPKVARAKRAVAGKHYWPKANLALSRAKRAVAGKHYWPKANLALSRAKRAVAGKHYWPKANLALSRAKRAVAGKHYWPKANLKFARAKRAVAGKHYWPKANLKVAREKRAVARKHYWPKANLKVAREKRAVARKHYWPKANLKVAREKRAVAGKHYWPKANLALSRAKRAVAGKHYWPKANLKVARAKRAVAGKHYWPKANLEVARAKRAVAPVAETDYWPKVAKAKRSADEEDEGDEGDEEEEGDEEVEDGAEEQDDEGGQFIVWPELKDSSTWAQWKNFFMETMNDQMGKDLAVYMYCKINM